MSAPVRHKILLLGLALGWLALFAVTVGWLVAPLTDVLRVLKPLLAVVGVMGLVGLIGLAGFVDWRAITRDRTAGDAARRKGSSCSRCL